ncbi:MAG TPA: tyrosine-protein phosphatase [Acidimicrobiales bacterium]|nr:tyrosine-protein phosphatase [Acidimicrobiales bacterium]
MPDPLADPPRRIALSGCFNFRDLGGYPAAEGRRVRWRRLFRADGLARLDSADCALLTELGLATVIDLRTRGELDERGSVPLERFEVDYHHLPLIDVLPPEQDMARYGEPAFVTGRYRQILSEGSFEVARAIEVLASPRALPAVFHCSAGKDRTGVLAAVVLGLLGVPDEVIVEDYALSAEAMVAMLEWLRTQYADSAESVDRYAPAVSSAHPEAMADFLAALRRDHGGFDELAASLGVSEAVDRLRDDLLEGG